MVMGRTDLRKVEVDGVRLALQRRGSDSPTVVFVAGLGDDAEVWSAVTAQLEDTASCVTYDRAGRGLSDDLPASSAALAQPSSWAAEQLRALLRASGIAGPVVLVGHSVGGQVADAFTTRWPEMVSGLVLVDAADPELNLRMSPPRLSLDDAAPSRAGWGWRWDVAASAREYVDIQPNRRPPTVVTSSAIWRWLEARQPDLYLPLSLAEVDQHWQHSQLMYARRWKGELVVAHEGGHRLHVDVPELIATVIREVLDTVAAGRPLQLDRRRILGVGGSVRPTSDVR